MYIELFYLFIWFYFASILQVYTFCCVYFNMGANNFWTQTQVVAGLFFYSYEGAFSGAENSENFHKCKKRRRDMT